MQWMILAPVSSLQCAGGDPRAVLRWLHDVCIEYESWRYEGARRITQRIPALNHVTLALRPGEIVGITGPNGSGKSTLLRAMCGVHAPVRGSILTFGRPPSLFDPNFKRRIAYSSSRRTALLPDLPLLDSFVLRRELFAIPRAVWNQSLYYLTDYLGLGSQLNRPPREFSQGQRARAELAATLFHRPELILLDEITSAIDLDYLPNLLSLLTGLSAKGATLCIISHRPHDLEAAHRLVTMDGGRITADEHLSDTAAAARN